MTLLNPWVLLGALLAALGSFGAGYWYGSGNAETQRVANEVRSQSAAVKEAATESARREGVSAARETSHEQIRTIYRVIKERAHELDVAASGIGAVGCGLDADGLQLWNAANSGTAPPLRSELNRGLPSAAASAVGAAGGLARQPYRGDGAGGTVSGSVEQVGGMHQQTRPAEGSAP